jgi:hypothetical protein
MNRPRAADDFATIRARMEVLRRERELAQAAEGELKPDPAMQRARSVRWPPSEVGNPNSPRPRTGSSNPSSSGESGANSRGRSEAGR